MRVLNFIVLLASVYCVNAYQVRYPYGGYNCGSLNYGAGYQSEGFDTIIDVEYDDDGPCVAGGGPVVGAGVTGTWEAAGPKTVVVIQPNPPTAVGDKPVIVAQPNPSVEHDEDIEDLNNDDEEESGEKGSQATRRLRYQNQFRQNPSRRIPSRLRQIQYSSKPSYIKQYDNQVNSYGSYSNNVRRNYGQGNSYGLDQRNLRRNYGQGCLYEQDRKNLRRNYGQVNSYGPQRKNLRRNYGQVDSYVRY